MFPNRTWAHENKGSIAVTRGKLDAKASRQSNKDALSGVPVRHKPSGNLGSMHATAWKATCKYQCASHTQIQQRFASARHNRNTAKAFTCLGVQQATWTNDAPR